MLNKRAIQLLSTLLINDKTVTGTKLSEQVGVSTRTIRNDIQQMNIHLNQINTRINSNTDGYYINVEERDIIKRFLNDNQNYATYIPTTPSERTLYVLLSLLLENKILSSNELAERLYVSKATIYGDIKRLATLINKSHETKIIFNDVQGVRMIGSEMERRKAVIKYLDSNEINLDLYWKILELISNVQMIKDKSLTLYQYIIQEVSNYKAYLPDKEITSLTRILTICALRIKEKNLVEEIVEIPIDDMTLNLIERLSQLFRVGFNAFEVRFIQGCLDSKRSINVLELENPDDDIVEIIEHFLIEVYVKYGFDFKRNDTLKKSLYLHIKPMLRRLRANEYENNILKNEIKRKFVLASEIAMSLLTIIFEKYALVMSDSEVSYVALHIASALEVTITPTRVIIISEVTTGGRQLIISKLENHFMSKIDIAQFLSITQFQYLYENNLLPKCDLIITTSFINYSDSIPVVKINPLVFRDDISSLKRYIHYYSTDIKNKQSFYSLFQVELFHYFDEETTYFQCIIKLVSSLKKQGVINDEKQFYELVLERENTCSTILDNQIAIPHASMNIANQTKIAVAILNKPIEVNDKKISVILLNAIGKDGDFQKVYSAIEKVLEYPEIAQFSRCREFDDFIEIMKV